MDRIGLVRPRLVLRRPLLLRRAVAPEVTGRCPPLSSVIIIIIMMIIIIIVIIITVISTIITTIITIIIITIITISITIITIDYCYYLFYYRIILLTRRCPPLSRLRDLGPTDNCYIIYCCYYYYYYYYVYCLLSLCYFYI